MSVHEVIIDTLRTTSIMAVAWLAKKAYQHVTDSKKARELRQRLFGPLLKDFLDNMQLDAGCEHIYRKGKMDPDHCWVIENSFGLIRKLFPRRPCRYVNAGMHRLNWKNNIVALGHFGSCITSRLIMGYRSRHSYPKTKLPFAFKPYVKNEVMVKRILEREPGIDVWESPAGGIIEGMSRKRVLSIYPDSEGWQRRDALLITVAPSLTKEGREHDKKVVNFAGVHGPATRAAVIVWNDLKLLEKIDEGREGCDYFQAIVRVDELKHDVRNRETLPVKGSLSVGRVEPFHEKDIPTRSEEWLNSQVLKILGERVHTTSF